ncbi:MAG TPA: sulfatase-like hydrolase/transferase, partial [Puia sp.]|nr:sulfatase-like hydrolase/transferase [Puia sp.]
TATMQVSALPDHRPRFVYTHVMMPHEPFLFDSLLRWRSVKEIRMPAPRLKDYLGYLPYTNSRIRQLITTIKKNTGGKAVILFMSDHGFRYWEEHIPDSVFFRNQNAVYFPDGNYSGFYDNISNVNQFRLVFDKLFHLELPLLKDSTILLLDKN